MVYLPSRYYPQQAWLIKLVAAGMILAMGISRMLLGMHWPTDVMGGYAAGACVLCASVYGYEGHAGLAHLVMQRWNARGEP